jgi:hypothetical protein
VSIPGPSVSWTFRLSGGNQGTATLTLHLLHEDHSDFDSTPIPVSTGSGSPGIVPEAFHVREGCNALATYGYDPSLGPQATTGHVVVPLGSTRRITAGFLGAYDAGRPNDKRVEIPITDPDYTLSWSVDDPSVAGLDPVPGAAWDVDLAGNAPGLTTAVFRLMYRGEERYASGPIRLLVIGDPDGLPVPDHYLNYGGAWTFIVQDDTVRASGCGRQANPGYIDLEVGELTALYTITLLDGCNKVQLDDGYEYGFVFADPCVGRIVNHPIHWGEDTVFHLEGLSAGTTNLRIYVLNGSAFEFATPWIPVVVQ